MATKPAQLCELQKGKFVGGQKNFVDTFNWVVSSMNNLQGSGDIEVDWTLDDHPTITRSDTSQESNGDSGGGSGGNVDDVSMETYQSGDSLLIEYADETADKHIPLSYVKDVSSDTYQSKPALKIEYSSGAQDKYIPIATGVTFNGNDQSVSSTDEEFTFASASDSNVVVNCNGTTITVGVYYV